MGAFSKENSSKNQTGRPWTDLIRMKTILEASMEAYAMSKRPWTCTWKRRGRVIEHSPLHRKVAKLAMNFLTILFPLGR